MNSLSAKIAGLLGAVFMLMGFLVVVAAQVEPALLSVPAILGVIGLTLVAAWCLLQPITRRIGQLADAVESLQRGGFAAPLKRFDSVGQLPDPPRNRLRSEEHTSELQSLTNLVCR